MSPAAFAPLMWGIAGLVFVMLVRWTAIRFWDPGHPLRGHRRAA
jgi:hypothetical protein